MHSCSASFHKGNKGLFFYVSLLDIRFYQARSVDLRFLIG